MIVRSLDNLREAGLYERYLTLLSAEQRDAIQYGVAASWIPVEAAVAHYRACDALALGARQVDEFGSQFAQRIAPTFFAGALRKARGMGLDGLRFGLSKLDVLSSRMYRGGASTLIELGPKEMIYEVRGYAMAETAYFRTSYVAFARAAAGMFCKTVFVKPTAVREPDPRSIAVIISWV